jgi:4-hydroxybenzoate polyprenyltransferase
VISARVWAWLEVMRISNAPTVVSNALTGCAIGAGGVAAGVFPWSTWALVAPALVLIYVAGMATNDVLDAGVDRVERPGRPIPSGRVARSAAATFAVVATGAAIGLLSCISWHAAASGGVLALCALAYNTLHKRSALTVAIMGGCRALAVATAAVAAGWWFGAPAVKLVVVCAVLWAYIVLISLVARAEAGSRRRVKVVVSMLCAIALLDAGVLAVLGWWAPAGVAVACFGLSAWAQRRVLGT